MGGGDNGQVRRQLDTDGDPAVQIAEIVAELEGVEPDELEAIWDRIDDILANVFSNPPDPAAEIEVRFRYEGYRITVTQDGTATVLDE